MSLQLRLISFKTLYDDYIFMDIKKDYGPLATNLWHESFFNL